MKKGLTLSVLSLSAILMMTGCGGSNKDNYSNYEIHFYDADFGHTEEVIAQYKEDGSLKKLETLIVADERGTYTCAQAQSEFKDSDDADYPEVTLDCKVDGEKISMKYTFTDKSLEAGYLKEDGDFLYSVRVNYEHMKDEKTAKEALEQQLEAFRNENIFEKDERNYIIIDGKRYDS